MNHPAEVMVWACFTGNFRRGSMYFLPPKVTMKEDRYLAMLKDKLPPFIGIHKARPAKTVPMPQDQQGDGMGQGELH
jgi:hypothetical protein